MTVIEVSFNLFTAKSKNTYYVEIIHGDYKRKSTDKAEVCGS